MKEFWDERFGAEEYAYGIEPNAFFKEQIDRLPAGRLLLPAEGEGRNAVYAARLGWEVTAFDQSIEGRKKALQLAQRSGLSIEYQKAAWEEADLTEGDFDAVGLVFAHMPPDQRTAFHRRLLRCLIPGGWVILEGFAEAQLGYSSGGPKNLPMLFSREKLLFDFESLEELELFEAEVNLDEGPYHQGPAAVIRLTGRKP